MCFFWRQITPEQRLCMEFLQHQGNGEIEKITFLKYPTFCRKTRSDVLWSKLSCAMMHVSCDQHLYAKVTVSVNSITIGIFGILIRIPIIDIVCCLNQAAPKHTGSRHRENFSVESHLLLISSRNLKDFKAVACVVLGLLNTSCRTASTLKDQTWNSYRNAFPVSQLVDDCTDGK